MQLQRQPAPGTTPCTTWGLGCVTLQVFALTKERDALKRAAAASSAGGSGASDVAALRGQLHKKDELASQVSGK